MPDARVLAASTPALDARQAEAVVAPPGLLLVLAGAGSGKTRVLTERAAAMVATHGQPAEALLVITFTNRAADELREWLERLIGAAARRMTIGTFHALGHRLLRAHARRVGRSSRFSVYDGHASRRLILQGDRRALRRHLHKRQQAPDPRQGQAAGARRRARRPERRAVGIVAENGVSPMAFGSCRTDGRRATPVIRVHPSLSEARRAGAG